MNILRSTITSAPPLLRAPRSWGLRTTWLLAVCAVAGFGCTDSAPATQVLTGKVSTAGALAVRAITSDSQVTTAATVRSDGSFTLALPAGAQYRLEVLTTSGVRHVLSTKSGALTALSFKVCQPTDPFDVGNVGPGPGTGSGSGSGMGGGSGSGGGPGDPPCMDPSDPHCQPPPPPTCDPSDPSCQPPPPPCTDPADPNCFPPPCTDPADPNCVPPPPPCTGPNDPNCMPPTGCTDPADPSCQPPPPPCTDPTDPNCGPCTDPTAPGCMPPPPPCNDPSDPYCACDASGACPPPTCASTDPMCPPPPPGPCTDPMDPTTCQDPCMADPASCGCSTADPHCWPDPQPPMCDPSGNCDPGTGGMTPDHPPGDLGCVEPSTP